MTINIDLSENQLGHINLHANSRKLSHIYTLSVNTYLKRSTHNKYQIKKNIFIIIQ